MPPIKYVVPVASGKGGVGKSTVSVNLALALVRSGATVGLLDLDLYGPSVPAILGISERPRSTADNHLIPIEKHGLKVMSIAFLVPSHEAVIWRGPMLHKMVQDFLRIVDWGELDFLVVDLPPGTGDIQLSLCQSIPVAGAVIVSTPQDVAWNVAQKAILMFDKLNAPILGVIENMSFYQCPRCGSKEEIFGHGGAQAAAKLLGIPFLGEIPLDTRLRTCSDQGQPIILQEPEHVLSKVFFKIAEKLKSEIQSLGARAEEKKLPQTISPPQSAEIKIEWKDGRRSVFEPRSLRLLCPCARCVDEWTGKKLLEESKLPPDMRALAINLVGRYALQIRWSDGHDTGLYSFDYLRGLS